MPEAQKQVPDRKQHQNRNTGKRLLLSVLSETPQNTPTSLGVGMNAAAYKQNILVRSITYCYIHYKICRINKLLQTYVRYSII